MTNDLITVVTPTFGFDSPLRLSVLCSELREFTKLPFRHIVCDDGTNSEAVRQSQRAICDHYNAEWMSNPGKPNFGASSNLSYLFSHVKTPWCYMVEDGVRPSLGWLEAAEDFITKIGQKEWGDERKQQVGLAGFAPMYAYLLAMGRRFNTTLPLNEWIESKNAGKYKSEHLNEFYGRWNDGLWNWDRVADNVLDTCIHVDISGWPSHFQCFRTVLMLGLNPPHDPHDVTVHDKVKFLYWTLGAWPQRRRAYLSWYGSPHVLVNMDAFRAVGGFRENCTSWDNLICLRMWQHDYLVLTVEGPPWLHLNGQGFRAADDGLEPRYRENHIDHIQADYGFDSWRAPIELSKVHVPLIRRRQIERQLQAVTLDEIEGWPKQ